MNRALPFLLLLISLAVASPAGANPRLFYYNGNAPMITFMLNMMESMGIIHRYPVNGAGGYGLSRYGSPWSYAGGMGSPFGGMGSPFGGMSPWNSWGGYSPYSPRGMGGSPTSFGSPWSGAGPWPFNGVDADDNPWLYEGMVPRKRYSRYGPSACGEYGCVRPRELDGVWLSSTGEILGIQANRLVWSDGQNTYAAGFIERSPGYLYARLNGATTSTPYSYKLAGNQLNLRDIDGSVRRFYRLPGSSWDDQLDYYYGNNPGNYAGGNYYGGSYYGNRGNGYGDY
jgi:hypothetical protein